MEPAAVVTLVAVLLAILALVVYLVAVILELRKITAGLDAVIAPVGEIVSKSEPVNGVVEAINKDLSAGTDLLEGLLDKKAGQDDAGKIDFAGKTLGGVRCNWRGSDGRARLGRGRCRVPHSGTRPTPAPRRARSTAIRAAPSPMSPEGPGTSPGPRRSAPRPLQMATQRRTSRRRRMVSRRREVL